MIFYIITYKNVTFNFHLKAPAEPVLIMMSGLNLLINNVVEIAALTFPMPLWVITTSLSFKMPV